MACDDRLDFIADVNQAPEITVQTGTNVDYKIKDDIKGPGEPYYEMVLFFEDAEGFDGTVTATFVNGVGLIQDEQGNEITGSFPYTNLSQKTIRFDSEGYNGVYVIRLTATDNLGKSSTVDVTINAFKNKLPTASWSYTNIKLNDLYEYELNASASTDADAGQGGGIAGYEWTINGNKFVVRESKIPYVLSKASPSGTTYNIKLRVVDNNGEYSEVDEKYITVN